MAEEKGEVVVVVSTEELEHMQLLNKRREANSQIIEEAEKRRAALLMEDEAWWNEIREKHNLPVSKYPILHLDHDTLEVKAITLEQAKAIEAQKLRNY